MHHRTALALAALAFTLGTGSTPAQAAFQLNHIGLQCSDSLVVQEGDAYTLSCSGDLSLQGLDGQGSFQADTSITLNATGHLSLLDVLLQAPRIVLNAGTVSVNPGSALTLVPVGTSDPRLTPPGTDPGAGGVLLVNGVDIGTSGGGQVLPGGRTEGGDIVVGGGSLGSNDPKFGDVNLPTLGSPVPEAGSFAMMAAGLIGLVALRVRGRAAAKR